MNHLGCEPYQVCSNDDPMLTLTYFMARSNLYSNAFIGEKLVSHSRSADLLVTHLENLTFMIRVWQLTIVLISMVLIL